MECWFFICEVDPQNSASTSECKIGGRINSKFKPSVDREDGTIGQSLKVGGPCFESRGAPIRWPQATAPLTLLIQGYILSNSASLCKGAIRIQDMRVVCVYVCARVRACMRVRACLFVCSCACWSSTFEIFCTMAWPINSWDPKPHPPPQPWGQNWSWKVYYVLSNVSC